MGYGNLVPCWDVLAVRRDVQDPILSGGDAGIYITTWAVKTRQERSTGELKNANFMWFYQHVQNKNVSFAKQEYRSWMPSNTPIKRFSRVI